MIFSTGKKIGLKKTTVLQVEVGDVIAWKTAAVAAFFVQGSLVRRQPSTSDLALTNQKNKSYKFKKT